jgi:hypothetical protein
VSSFEETTGLQVWTETLATSGNADAPIAYDGTLYFDVANGYVDAMSESTGAVLWSVNTDDGTYVTRAGSTIIASNQCGHDFGLNAGTGAVEWSNNGTCVGGGSTSSSFDGSQVWAEGFLGGQEGQDGQILDPASGAVAASLTGYTPAFGYGEAILAVPSNGGPETGDPNGMKGLEAIDPTTRDVRWTFGTSGTSQLSASEPLLADGYAFEEGTGGQVWALNPCTGSIVWQGQVSSGAGNGYLFPLVSLAAGDGYLVVPDSTGIVAFKGSASPTGPAPNCADPSSAPTGAGPSSGAPTTPSSGAPGAQPSGGSSRSTPARGTDGPVISLVDVTLSRRGCTVTLRLAATGRLTFRLLRGRHQVAAGHRTLRHARFRLTLRVSLPPGSYRLAMTFHATGHPTVALTRRLRFA